MLTQQIVSLEDSLKEFLIEEALNTPDREDSKIYKYRALKISVDARQECSEPCFSVQIGIFEAVFSVESGEKLSGGFGTDDENLIFRWLNINSNRQLIKLACLGMAQEAVKIRITPFDMD